MGARTILFAPIAVVTEVMGCIDVVRPGGNCWVVMPGCRVWGCMGCRVWGLNMSWDWVGS